jgi:type III secretion system low calcium response chaperone LcrH/SycD
MAMTDKLNELERARLEVRAAIEKRGDEIPPKARPLVEEAIAKMKVDNLLPKDVLGFSPAVMEVIYQQGYNLFQNGKYQDALIIFNTLRQLDITDTRYTFAIAACHHYSKQYLDAAANYLIYKYMDPFNPLPCFHLYDCYLKENYPMSALFAIQEAFILAENSPKDAGLKEKIQIELNHLKENLNTDFNTKNESTV